MATTPSRKARLFVAMDLPGDARDALVAWRERAFAGRDDVRLVVPEALHVTLVFLGHLPEEEIARIAELMRSSIPSGPAPMLTATGVKAIPPRRTRLFALDLDDEHRRGAVIWDALSNSFEAAGLYEPEKRAFWPHVTLARVRKGAVANAAPGDPPPPADTWQAAAVTLYRSTLRREGARYDALERVPLG